MSSIRIKIPIGELEIERAHMFHLANVGEFLFPRSLETFKQIVEGYSALIALDGEQIVGLCYVVEEIRSPVETSAWSRRWEFGGVIVIEDSRYRGQGVASALGTVAIAHQFYSNAENVSEVDGGLIAHVHVENELPRALLTRYLGFVDTGEIECLPAELAAELRMRKNEDGEVCGNVYRFRPAHLSELAGRIENTRLAKIDVDIDLRWARSAEDRTEAVRELRELAGQTILTTS